jgi:hypothetical protein
MLRGSRTCVWMLASALFLGSLACKAADHVVRVSAQRDPGMAGSTYWLVPGMDGVEPGHLEYRAFASLVERSLAARGYVRVDEGTRPHMVLLLSYGVGPPQSKSRTRGWAIPTTTSTTVQGWRSPTTGLSTPSTITTTSWTYGVASASWTEYTSWLRLSALEGGSYLEGRPVREIWNTLAYTDSKSRDLLEIFPVLLAVAMDYFALSSHREIVMHVPQRSPRIKWLRE